MMSEKNAHDSSLVIVESPAKAKTINRYLGAGYRVMASMGHVRDLPEKDLGIDLEQGFEPVYQILPARKRIVTELKKAAAKARDVYLATDLDREGEAIAWHLAHALDLDPDRAKRIVFNEITKSAIQTAFARPHGLDMDKVNAQQARRLLDRMVGYLLSPLLQAKLGKGLSAGRVQSVAVRLIVEREREIRAFVPEESWKISACFATQLAQLEKLIQGWSKLLKHAQQGKLTIAKRNEWLTQHQCLFAELVSLGGKPVKMKSVRDAQELAELLGFATDRIEETPWPEYERHHLRIVNLTGHVDREQAPRFTIHDIQRKRTTTKPNPPFTTAALQQAASSTLGFAPARTMRIAQQLYEGVEIDGDLVGLITYMRTDSTNLSRESVESARALIATEFGEPYLPPKPNVYGSAKRAQEAHEAIRPSDVTRTPDAVRSSLSSEQFRLYQLIWRRFVACQMTPAQWDNTTIQIGAETARGLALFRASGRKLVFDGHLRVLNGGNGGDVLLPEIEVHAPVGLVDLLPEQQYTSPPPRYSEAALVKKLESEGIGRPSTYAAIIQTIQDRGYVELVEKRLHPTERGEVVTDKLVAHFPDILNVKFTSFMEEELDKIEEAHLDWIHVLSEFYEPFRASLEKARVEMEAARARPSDYTCPECGKPMVYRLGRNGRFLSCTGYPDCKVSQNVDREGKPVEAVVAEEPCGVCGKPMVLKTSRLGPFLGCTGYPECTNTIPCDDNGTPLRKVAPEDITERCDACGQAMAVKFARGRAFLGCTAYPKCKTTKPLPPGIYVEKPKPEDAGVRCDKCGRPMVIRKSRRGPFLSCSGFPRCRNAMPTEKLDHLKQLEAEGKIPDPPPAQASDKGTRRNNGAGRSGKVSLEQLGPPPPGFAWTRTGRPVVEDWPKHPLSCPECGEEMELKSGRYGPYFGCTAYPKCRFVANLRGAAKKRAEEESGGSAKPKPIPTNLTCDECGAVLMIRTGRSGRFLGCGNYPKCRFTKPMPEGATLENLAAAN